MITLLKRINWTILALCIAGGMICGAVAYAQSDTQAATPQEMNTITFPIPELGNCTDKASCKVYCDAGEHIKECVTFAKAHGLMNKEEAIRAEKFASSIEGGKGPGNCDSPVGCKSYCEDIAHIEACMSFAEKQGFKGQDYEQGKKVMGFLKNGGKTPGGCTSRASCQEYCSNFSHAQECFEFAQKTGVADGATSGGREVQSGRQGDMPTLEQMKKLQALAETGETPGGCKTKDECMQYCRLDGHRDECVVFAEKAGFMNKDEATLAKNFHGGPGGCTSAESCHAFCNDPANQETCFKFAEENNLISKDEINRTKENWMRMREGITSAPPEVQACLKTVLGDNAIDDIQSGKLVPGPAIGEKLRGCFEKFGGHHDSASVFKEAPPQVTACLKEKLGDQFADLSSGKTQPTPEIADTFRMCFQQMELEHGMGMNDRGSNENGQQGGGPNPEMLKGYLRSAPPEVSTCLKEKIGSQFEQLLSGEVAPTPELGQTMKTCFEQFRPNKNQDGGASSTMMRGGGQMGAPQGGATINRMPPEVASCLKEKLGEEAFSKMGTERPTPEFEQTMKSCFTQFEGNKNMPPEQGGQGQPGVNQGGDILSRMPPAVTACLKEKLSAEQITQLTTGGTSVGGDVKEALTTCFGQFGKPQVPSTSQGGVLPPQGVAPQGSLGGSWISRLPAHVQLCVKTKIGEDVFTKAGMSAPTPEIEQAIKSCYTTVQSSTMQNGIPPPPEGTSMPPPGGGEGGMLPQTDIKQFPPPLAPPAIEAPQTRRNISALLLGAVAAPFLNLWGFF